MAYDRFLIAPLKTGLQTDLKPFLIMDDAFEELENAYVFRGRVRKRFGSILTGTGATTDEMKPLFSRVRIPLTGGAGVGITNGAGLAAGTVPGLKFRVGQQFSVGTVVFTVATAGAGVQMLRTDGSAEVATFNTATGAYSITIAALPATQVYFYPADPVMGLTLYEQGAIIEHDAFAFDTQFAYRYVGGSWIRQGTTVWHGTDSQFFWACNWEGSNTSDMLLFVTNYNAAKSGGPGANDDPIYSYSSSTGLFTAFRPHFKVAAGNHVQSCRIIVTFHDRLILLNTIESNNADAANFHYPARCRYSWNGVPIPAAPDDAWLEHNEVGWKGAGWIDATTDEEIVSAEFIKDRLIVYFERSTWELAYTGNQIQPFVWQKINTELGSDATFSSVPFDKVILTIGNSGIHACSGGNVDRIDSKIPDEIFDIRSENNGIERISGVRDYYTEMVYWTFPQYGGSNFSKTYPNKVLVYNYKNDSWALNDDSITCFGYFEQQDDTTWANAQFTWTSTGYTWTSGITQADFRQVIAGNQHGYIFIIAPDVSRNAPVLQITDAAYTGLDTILTIQGHNLNDGDYISIENGKSTGPVAFELADNTYKVSVLSADTVSIGDYPLSLVYLGGATATRESVMRIKSKQWNPYLEQGRNVQLAKIDFGVTRTDNVVVVDYSPSSTDLSLVAEGIATGAIMGDNLLETNAYATNPLESLQNRLWHTIYFQGEGECIQILITTNNAIMLLPELTHADFQLEGLILYTRPVGRLQ